jgi:VanZ family protein
MFDLHGKHLDRTWDARLARLLLVHPWLGLLAGAVLAVVTGILTLWPAPEPYPPRIFSPDKIYHFVAFFSIVFLVVATGPRRWIWVAPLAIAFGGVIELIQPHINRTGTWYDFAANTAGVAAGVWLGHRAHGWLHDRLAAARR